jgi:tetratricopeptide (TPR) repeat protein
MGVSAHSLEDCMPLASRFARLAALERRFVDREPVLAAFAGELRQVGSRPRVLNLVGVGGIGKSRLLRELAERTGKDTRSVILDLQVPVLRQQEDALAVLRMELGRQGAEFDRFDIAYTVLWQRLHPQLPVGRSGLPFTDESELLTQIVGDAAGVPVFATAVGLVKLVERLAWSTRRRWRIRHDETLGRLDSLSVADLADAVTFLFAEDLRDSSADKPFVVFIDAYEALVPTRLRSRRAGAADVWLRDLVGQLNRGLVVVASREPLGWQVHDPAWREHLSTVEVDGLPMAARLQLLSSSGITDAKQQQTIAAASDGLPFYLHLAVDTGLESEPATSTPLVSSEEILQRFLAHVDSDDIRILELLSFTRTFDHEVFRGLSEAFELPGHRMAWEALAAYSFVYPAGPNGLRLHQVMATALQGQLSGAAAGEVHAVLRHLLDGRATRPRPARSDTGDHVPVAALLREAAYHGLLAGEISGAELLDYGDRARVDGGTQALDGVLADLREFLDHGQADHHGQRQQADLADTAVCLAAEAAILRGDAAAAAELVPDIPAEVDGVVPARLAIAAAQARRIGGETAAALEGYTAVWERHRGPARLTAGLWAADLHMCQGRFRQAEQMAATLETESPPDWVEFGGDVARLRYLGFRFALDYDAARIHLDEAERRYAAAGSYIGRANIQTNRAELLSLTDAAAALGPARQAIETQRELGAGHEVGKAYTALAVAQLRLGHLDDAEDSLRSACEELQAAGYRSGRARAELFRAVLTARRGDLPAAQTSARWTVQELEAAQVYPTLIMAAAHAVERLGIPDEQLQAAAGRARAAIDAVDSLPALEARIDAAVTDLLGGQA